MPDLGDLMRRAASDPIKKPDVHEAFARGRRERIVRFGVLSATSLVTVVAVIAAATSWPPDDPKIVGPSPESEQGRIVFSRWGQDGGIMTMGADGSEVTAITPPSAYASTGAAWSPDGTRIAFTGYYGPAKNEGGGIFVADPDGSNRELLDLAAAAPTWSPDGKRIAFYSAVDGSIRVIDVRNRRSQIVVPAEGGRKDSPDWSPDGRSLLFSSDGIYKVDVEGGAAKQIVPPDNQRWRSYEPQWSPDGSMIAFAAPGEDGTSTIDVVDADGTGRRTLTEGASPTWSPDGERIAFEGATNTASSHIYSIKADGTDERQLTFGDVADHSPDWGLPRPVMGKPDEDAPETPYCVGDEICLSRRGGPAGVDVTASVPATGTAENGVDEIRTDRVEWWWGLEGEEWIDVFEGNPPEGASLLAVAEEPRGGRLVTSFIVPSGHDPGTYPIFAISYSSEGGHGASGSEIAFDLAEGYGCPTLLDPGPFRAFLREARPVIDAYLEARLPDEARAFDYGSERLERPTLGGPQGDCSAETWQRSYQVEGSFEWKEGFKRPSYFRFVVGRAEGGWVIWAVAP